MWYFQQSKINNCTEKLFGNFCHIGTIMSGMWLRNVIGISSGSGSVVQPSTKISWHDEHVKVSTTNDRY